MDLLDLARDRDSASCLSRGLGDPAGYGGMVRHIVGERAHKGNDRNAAAAWREPDTTSDQLGNTATVPVSRTP
jgi:hypothetical protein